MITKDFIKKYKDLKSTHPEGVLLFRKNDSYYSFFEDAEKTSDSCNIASLEETDEDGTHTLCSAFPYHALDTYLPKLIRAGNRVYICDFE